MRSFSVAAIIGWHHVYSVVSMASVVLENRRSLPNGWKFAKDAPPNASLVVSIALAQPRLVELEDFMLQRAASTPINSFSPLSHSDMSRYQQPHDAAADTVLDWLSDHGIRDAKADGPWVRLDATVEALRKLFEADMAYYTYNDSKVPVLRTQSYSIPEPLAHLVNFVFPLAHFMPPQGGRKPSARFADSSRRRSMVRRQPTTACMSNAVTPDCIRQIYNWPLTLPPPATNSSEPPSQVRFGIAGFLNEYINYQDVGEFLQVYAPRVAHAHASPAYNFTVELVNNGTNIQIPRYRAGMEASLDVQYAMALAYPTQVVYYSTGGRGEKIDAGGHIIDPRHSDNEPYLNLLEYLVDLPDESLPHVLSISYSDDEQSVPQPYAMRVCQLFMQLTSRGTTILVATGDGGSRGIGRNPCKRNNGSHEPSLLPTFPASCPWVTAVGATEAPSQGPWAADRPVTNATGSVRPPATAADYSSGGFSNYFARPSWQDESVTSYMERIGNEKQGLYNRSGRAVPDISAVGSHFRVVWGAVMSSADGTSASTPVVASMIALANDARLRAGKPVLGWLNPMLYSERTQAILQDIVDGVSLGCPLNRTAKAPGWPAMPGWDAVTGLGVPSDFSAFTAALMEM